MVEGSVQTAGGRPLIGVSGYLEQAAQGPWQQRYGMLPETYLAAVEAAGGVPVILPPQPATPDGVGRVLDAIDGLVLSGGADVDPALYGAVPEPHTQPPRHDRDAWEQALAAGAVERDLPLLAICRGVQLLNVTLGGTLHQHVPDITTTDHGDSPGDYARTEVAVVDGTLVRGVLGDGRLGVHCHHHQSLDRVAASLLVAARSDDGIVEAVESRQHPFVLGVQWHPEQDAGDGRLFAALVRAAQQPVPAGAGDPAQRTGADDGGGRG